MNVEYQESPPRVRFIDWFKQEVCLFWRTYRWLLALFILAQLCDAASTACFMLYDVSAEELHPAMALSARWFGPILGPALGAIGKIVAVLIAGVYLRRFGRVVLFALLLAGTVLGFWAAWYNMWGYAIYVPRLLMWLAF